MKHKKFVEEFFHTAKAEMIKTNNQRNHCILMYKTENVGTKDEVKILHKVYKNINKFGKKAEKDIDEVENKYRILLQIWYFD